MTGRQAGYCTGHDWPGRQGAAFLRGGGFHGSPRGFAQGRKHRGALQAQLDVLRSELDRVGQQLAAIEAKEEK